MSSNAETFESTFHACYEPVTRYAARRVAADAVADVVAETFIVAWRRFGDLDGDALPWLLGIARRVAANQRRASSRREALTERLRADADLRAHEPLPAGDARLAAALAELSERDREALMLVAWDGLEHRAAATVLGCSTSAFTVRVHRARRKLAHALTINEQGGRDAPQDMRSLT